MHDPMISSEIAIGAAPTLAFCLRHWFARPAAVQLARRLTLDRLPARFRLRSSGVVTIRRRAHCASLSVQKHPLCHFCNRIAQPPTPITHS